MSRWLRRRAGRKQAESGNAEGSSFAAAGSAALTTSAADQGADRWPYQPPAPDADSHRLFAPSSPDPAGPDTSPGGNGFAAPGAPTADPPFVTVPTVVTEPERIAQPAPTPERARTPEPAPAPEPMPVAGTAPVTGPTVDPEPLAEPAAPAAADLRAELDRLRRDYDAALAGTGVVLFQQVAVGVDGYHLSTSMATVLGWDPAAFTREGVLRGLVHPADLDRFERIFSARPSEPVDPWVETETIIDLTAADDSVVMTTEPIGVAAAPTPVLRLRDSTGSWRRMQVRLRTTGLAGASARAGSLVDVTADAREYEAARRFAEIVEHDPSGCLVLEFTDLSDPSSLVIRSANRSAHRMFDLDRRVVDGTPIGSVLGEASAQLVRHALYDVCHTGESMTAERLSLGEVRGTYLDLRVDRLADGTLGMTVTDVTGTVALEERLRHQASHDALTGLPNRALLEERLGGMVAAADRFSPVALAIVDVDRLREINETMGLHLGDQLLVEIGRRLVREARGAAVVSRLGGDEFAVLTMPCSDDTEALERIAAVRSALARPYDVDGHLVQCDTTIGVALAPTHSEDGRSLLRAAQSALDTAKEAGAPYKVYEATGSPGSISRLALLTELRQGLANRDLELRYQPMVDLRTGRVTKLEALLSWQDGVASARLPMEFVELAEQSGLIRPLTRWIVGEAASAAALLSDDDRELVVTTNLSMHNLCDPDLASFLHQLVAAGDLPVDRVEFEVNETELMDDPATAQETLAELAEFGLRFVVDEFGTGYTSLSTMQHLAVTGLKIDRSFITVIGSDPSDAAIVRSTVELAHELGLVVAADGVPDAATLAQLASFGCDLAQGVHLSPPVPVEQLTGRITELEAAVRGWIGSVDTASE